MFDSFNAGGFGAQRAGGLLAFIHQQNQSTFIKLNFFNLNEMVDWFVLFDERESKGSPIQLPSINHIQLHSKTNSIVFDLLNCEMIDWNCWMLDWLKIYYNSTCFIDHIFLKGYHPSINQHLITVIIMNGVKQSSNFSTMNEIQSTFWLNGMVCWFVWWWLMEWLCCPFTQLRWLRVVSYRFSFQHQLQSTINQTNQFISLLLNQQINFTFSLLMKQKIN